MGLSGLEPSATTLAKVAAALDSVPRAAYSVPHVYPSAAPAYTHAPRAERPPLLHDVLRLYVHVPFCRYRCTFCYYAVAVDAATEKMERYVRALEAELQWVKPGTTLTQLFMGGGTPTALPPELLDRLLEAIFSRTVTDGVTVHTVEASPETLSAAHIEVLKRRGIGRVSMGIQSFSDAVLAGVYRRHTRAQALAACELLVDSGLIANVDLIYGLPGQTEQMFLDDLHALAERGVPSLSLYSLRLNEHTPVAKTLRPQDRFDLAGLMRWRAFVKRSAEEFGYTQTRWHTFKRLGTAARTHEQLPFFDESMSGYQLGIGMSARSHLGYTVYRNHERLAVYLNRVEHHESPVEHVFPLQEDDRITQFIARTLGDARILFRSQYAATFGRPVDEDFGELLRRLGAAELIDDDGERITLSDLGKRIYDLVMLAFYPQRARDWLAARQDRAGLVRPGAHVAPSGASL
jgi:oxygen-independent coproporphyrinogen III oxidase